MSRNQRPKMEPRPQHGLLAQHLADALMIGLVSFAGIFAILQVQQGNPMEHCNTCTQTITGNDNQNYTFSGGEVFCIARGGIYRGNLTLRGNSSPILIVNEGEFNAGQVQIQKGEITFENYGNASPGNFTTHKNAETVIRNQANADFSPSSLTLRGEDTEFYNYGQLSPQHFTMDNEAKLYNEAGGVAMMPRTTLNGGSIVNRGTFNVLAGNMILNNDGELENFGDLEVGGEMKLNGGSEWTNRGRALIQDLLMINNAEVVNDSLITVVGNMTLNGGGEIELGGIIEVQEDFTLNGTIEGPSSGGQYGAILVGGVSTINGSGVMEGQLDFCDAGQPTSGADKNYSSQVNPSVTFCQNGPSNSPGALPVELTEFEASVVNGAIEIRWQTATELNNDYFVLERSGSNRQFGPIARIQGAGNSESPLNYRHIDRSNLSGSVFYRLQQTDFDGQSTYSPVVEVKIGTDVSPRAELRLYPNPARERTTLSITAPKAQGVLINVMTSQGQKLYSYQADLMTGTTEVPMALGSLGAGIYLVSVQNEDGELLGTPMRLIKE